MRYPKMSIYYYLEGDLQRSLLLTYLVDGEPDVCLKQEYYHKKYIIWNKNIPKTRFSPDGCPFTWAYIVQCLCMCETGY